MLHFCQKTGQARLPKRHDLSSKASKESVEISEGVVIDYDEDGHITGIDIDNASHKIDLNEIILNKIPAQLQSIHA
jgi:uncharacterized protein YuzE